MFNQPHSPCVDNTDIRSMTFPLGCVSFHMVKVAVGACQEVKGLLQVSLAVGWAVKVGISVGSRVSVKVAMSAVGEGSNVFVGAGVSVIGMNVLVGMDVCASAVAVSAAPPLILDGVETAVGAVLHALTIIASAII